MRTPRECSQTRTPTRAPARSRQPAAAPRRRTYINPFAGEAWAPSRNDQGVDYDPLKIEPIRAIGAGTILDIGSWGSYGPWFDYKLADGQFAGKCIYVASTSAASSRRARPSAPATRSRPPIRAGLDRWGWAKALDTPALPGLSAAAPSRTTSTPAAAVREVPAQPRRKDRTGSGPGPMYAGGSC